jgi:hypothetical protein
MAGEALEKLLLAEKLAQECVHSRLGTGVSV